ncbi:MAG: histone deacetylase family protein [Rhodobacteraceae bacterium]|nr:MAG: histone deacetylase family protein [Paracoccaceae bacterium]
MRTVHSDRHLLRANRTELNQGRLVPPFEKPERVAHILARLAERGFPAVEPPVEHGLDMVARVHAPDYLHFLETVWPRWTAAGYAGEAIPTVWPSRRMTRKGPPEEIDGAIGWYALCGETSISGGTWEAARAAADVALTAADLVAGGERAAFALCRPPGHHAAQDMFGGYCFLNNAAIAAERLRDRGAATVAVLDVDFHHGNGTQAIFWERADVPFLSLHGDPRFEFPYFLGGADEIGAGKGEGRNVNYPLPPGTGFEAWAAALEDACARIKAFGAEALVVSLGVDTFAGDPISSFKLASPDFLTYGARIARLGLPTLFVMEGGYAVAEIGVNTVNVLEGFQGA